MEYTYSEMFFTLRNNRANDVFVCYIHFCAGIMGVFIQSGTENCRLYQAYNGRESKKLRILSTAAATLK